MILIVDTEKQEAWEASKAEALRGEEVDFEIVQRKWLLRKFINWAWAKNIIHDDDLTGDLVAMFYEDQYPSEKEKI